MNEVSLPKHISVREIFAIILTKWMKMQVAERSHRHSARLKWKPFSPADGDSIVFYGIAENGTREGDLARSERALATNRAAGSERCLF